MLHRSDPKGTHMQSAYQHSFRALDHVHRPSLVFGAAAEEHQGKYRNPKLHSKASGLVRCERLAFGIPVLLLLHMFEDRGSPDVALLQQSWDWIIGSDLVYNVSWTR